MLISSDGIVLRQHKIAGNRRMITLFTRNYGKISAGTSMNERGKGRSALALRPFTYAEYQLFKGRGSYNINHADVKESFYSIGEDLDRFLIASKFLEFLDAILLEEERKPRLFELTVEFLRSLVRSKGGYETLLWAFVVKTFSFQGILPEMRHCVNCGKEAEVMRKESGFPPFFSVTAGGVLCRSCAEECGISRKIKQNHASNLHGSTKRDAEALNFEPDFDIVEVLQFFLKEPLHTFENLQLRPERAAVIREILNVYAEYYLDTNVLRGELRL